MERDDKRKLQALLRGSTRQQLIRALARMILEEEQERRRLDEQRDTGRRS